MFKKRFAGNIKSKETKIQKRDLFSRIIAFNIDGLIRIGKEVILIFIKIIRVSY